MESVTIVGIDLSGPANEKDTAVVSAVVRSNRLASVAEHGGTDSQILDLIRKLGASSSVVVGIDAPLSYQPGGGQRARDADLRRRLTAAGLHPGSVMAPTFQRMAWLTLRGIGLAHVLRETGCAVIEVHPAGAMVLRGAPVDDVRSFKDDSASRSHLLAWLATAGFSDISIASDCSSHTVAACAAVLAAHSWHCSNTVWLARAELPWHPFDFAC